MARGGFVECRGNDFTLDRALHFRHFFGSLVNEKHHQNAIGVIGGDGMRNGLHQNRLTCLGAGDDQAALTFADRSDDVNQSSRYVFFAAHIAFQTQRLGREKRREIFKEHAVLELFGRKAVHRIDFDECKVAFVVFGCTDFAFDRVAGVQVEAADLRGRNIDVVGARKVARVGAAQKAETIGQNFERAVAENLFALFGTLFENCEHEFLLAHALRIVDLKFGSHLKQLADVQCFELREMHFEVNVQIV